MDGAFHHTTSILLTALSMGSQYASSSRSNSTTFLRKPFTNYFAPRQSIDSDDIDRSGIDQKVGRRRLDFSTNCFLERSTPLVAVVTITTSGVPSVGFEKMKATPEAVTVALDLHFKGISMRAIVDHLKQFYGVEVSHVAIYKWIDRCIFKVSIKHIFSI